MRLINALWWAFKDWIGIGTDADRDHLERCIIKTKVIEMEQLAKNYRTVGMAEIAAQIEREALRLYRESQDA